MTEWIDDSAQPPPVLNGDPRRDSCAGLNRLTNNRIRVIDDKKYSAGRSTDRGRAETLQARTRRRYPERGVANGELGDNVVALANAVEHNGRKRQFVERDGGCRAIDPKLRLNAHHTPIIGRAPGSLPNAGPANKV